MIRCAFADSFRLATLIPARFRPSISLSSTRGSTTTPLPITQALSEWRIPEGIRWHWSSSPSRPILCPALLPPWKRTIVVARSASRSVILPLPSSPHWAPTMTTPGTGWILTGAAGGCGAGCGAGGPAPRQGAARDRPVTAIVAEHRHFVADLGQPRDGPRTDLLLELFVGQIGRDHHRAFGLVALVDQRVELLEHPVGAFLGAEVVDVEEVDRGELVEEGEVVVAAGFGVVGGGDPGP